jgi:hypothetical protein
MSGAAMKHRSRPTRSRHAPLNPHDPRLLTRIWRHLDRKGREQLLTAAFGMLRAQVRGLDVSHGPAQLRKVLFRSNARAPFDKVLMCGPGKSIFGDIPMRAMALGRYQRPTRWLVNGNLIAPHWRDGESSADSAA